MSFSEQIMGWFKPTSAAPAGVAIHTQIQLPKADLSIFAGIYGLAQRLELKGSMRMNMAGLITAELEGPRLAMSSFYNDLKSGTFCSRELISPFRRSVYKAHYKALSQNFDRDLSTYLSKPDPAKPIAL